MAFVHLVKVAIQITTAMEPQPDRRDAKASAKCPASAACCSACSTRVALGRVRDMRTSYHSVNYRVRLFRWHGWCHLDNNLGFYDYSQRLELPNVQPQLLHLKLLPCLPWAKMPPEDATSAHPSHQAAIRWVVPEAPEAL